MSVYELANLYIEGSKDMQIWNGNTQETVFEGTFDEAKYSNFADCEVLSFGIEDGILVINIDEDMED